MTESPAPRLDRVEVPAYVYDLDEVRRAHGLLRAVPPRPSRLLYSLKANPIRDHADADRARLRRRDLLLGRAGRRAGGWRRYRPDPLHRP